MKLNAGMRPILALVAVSFLTPASSALAQDPSEGLHREGEEVTFTRYTYLPNGRVLAETFVGTVDRSRDPRVGIAFLNARGEMIRPRNREDMEMRIEAAKEIEQLGYLADWRYFTYQDLTNVKIRITKANELKAAGVKVDWHDHDTWELLEMVDVLKAKAQLRELGVEPDTLAQDLKSLQDSVARVRKARELAKQGVNVDWREHSLESLRALEGRPASK